MSALSRGILLVVAYVAAGTSTTMITYPLFRHAAGVTAIQRSLDGLIGFLDLVVYTGFAFALAGLLGGVAVAMMNWRAAAVALTAAVLALLVALVLAPSMAHRPTYGLAVAAGGLVAAVLGSVSGLLRRTVRLEA